MPTDLLTMPITEEFEEDGLIDYADGLIDDADY